MLTKLHSMIKLNGDRNNNNNNKIILMFQVDEESRGGFWSQCDVETS